MDLDEKIETILEILSQEVYWEQLFDSETDIINTKGVLRERIKSVLEDY